METKVNNKNDDYDIAPSASQNQPGLLGQGLCPNCTPSPRKGRTGNGMQQTHCRSFVASFNLARRARPTSPQPYPYPQPFGRLEVGRGSRAALKRVSESSRAADRPASTSKANDRNDILCILVLHTSYKSSRPAAQGAVRNKLRRLASWAGCGEVRQATQR